MNYFHTTHPATIDFIARVATIAHEQGQSLRIDVDSKGQLRIKRGGGVWTAPFASDPDPYRDAPVEPKHVLVETSEGIVRFEV